MVQITIRKDRAFSGSYRNFLAVSHRWLGKDEPDAEGAQLRELQDFLEQHPEIEYVWYDYWCMPQGSRTNAERVRFAWMLKNSNLLVSATATLLFPIFSPALARLRVAVPGYASTNFVGPLVYVAVLDTH